MTHSRRPWLEPRDGESRDEWLIRTARSCYWCPHPAFRNATEASDHEDVCWQNPHARHTQR
jgi:hypothetical protein